MSQPIHPAIPINPPFEVDNNPNPTQPPTVNPAAVPSVIPTNAPPSAIPIPTGQPS